MWSAAAWGEGGGNTTSAVLAALLEYASVFISPAMASEVVEVILGLEQAWMGSLATNPAINRTLATIREVEATMQPAQASNWRLQQLRYRAYYDAFVQARSDLLRAISPRDGGSAVAYLYPMQYLIYS